MTGMDIGLTPKPEEAAEIFAAVGGKPAFARVFSKPGAGLPNPNGTAVQGLPEGCLPWFSHKDPVPLDEVKDLWMRLWDADKTRRYRWTYHHEAAPATWTGLIAYRQYWTDLKYAALAHPNIELVQIQSDYAMRRRVDTNWRDWIIPGVSLGFDCYPLAGYRYEPPESMFALVQAAAAGYDCPSWGVPELGADLRLGQDRSLWLSDAVHHLKASGAAFVGLWASHERRDGRVYDYGPHDSHTLAAFREILREEIP